ncbi:MAG: hypothetical protein JSR84_01060 [Proteobacteria bacterium]|nr:hypothetical protein [Pseudomonadota bacterium]
MSAQVYSLTRGSIVVRLDPASFPDHAEYEVAGWRTELCGHPVVVHRSIRGGTTPRLSIAAWTISEPRTGMRVRGGSVGQDRRSLLQAAAAFLEERGGHDFLERVIVRTLAKSAGGPPDPPAPPVPAGGVGGWNNAARLIGAGPRTRR